MKSKIWAHRGSSAQAPENTLAAFDLAARQQADGVELDVQRTADDVLVVTHDEDCRRVTGIPGLIAQMTLAELRGLNFAAFRPETGTHEIPTLAEVFDLLLPTGLTINIELKNSVNLYPGMEAQVLDLAVRHGMAERIQLSSFNHYSLMTAKRLILERHLTVPCGALYSCGLVDPWQYAAGIGLDAIHPHFAALRIPGLIEQCHALGIAINAWTIDKPENIRTALELGIDAIITNVPALAREIRDSSKQAG